jgi:hypothetical protein
LPLPKKYTCSCDFAFAFGRAPFDLGPGIAFVLRAIARDSCFAVSRFAVVVFFAINVSVSLQPVSKLWHAAFGHKILTDL